MGKHNYYVLRKRKKIIKIIKTKLQINQNKIKIEKEKKVKH